MRILIVHNAYQLHGGEDSVCANEAELLRAAGHDVSVLRADNAGISGGLAAAKAAVGTTYSLSGKRMVADAIAAHRPDVVHVHNFFPLISPSMFDACRAAGVPVVWSLHNYRIACANGLLLRDEKPCELCVSQPPFAAIRYRCYRGSMAGSAALAISIGYHRLAGTWKHKVDRFIALNRFARGKFIEAGLPPERIVIKPNFVADPGPSGNHPRAGALFVGRLSEEKGVRTLIAAWRGIAAPLTIVGDGPLRAELEATAPANVTFAGLKDADGVRAHMRAAAMLVVPSTWYENFPMTIVEAFAVGTPVVASRLGALPEIVEDGVSGLLFDAGDADHLRQTATALLTDPDRAAKLGAGARAEYAKTMTPGANLKMLETIYRDVIAARGHPVAA